MTFSTFNTAYLPPNTMAKKMGLFIIALIKFGRIVGIMT